MKKRGFTLIELMITLGITVIILGVIYTFFLVSSRTLTSTNLKSDLQNEAYSIEDILLEKCNESEGIISIYDLNNLKIEKYSDVFNEQDVTEGNFVEVSEIDLDNCTIKFDSENGKLSIDIDGQESDFENVTSFEVVPLDIASVNLREDSSNFENSTGLQFSISLSKTEGYSTVDKTFKVTVSFRNK